MYPKQEIPIGKEVLRVEGLTVSHPYIVGKNIVEDISFSVHSGEILGVSGLVGSGRSETMNAIFGSLKRESGKIFVDGEEVSISNPNQAMKKRIGLVTEDRKKSGIIATMCLRENMTLANLDSLSKLGLILKKQEISISESFLGKLKVRAEGIEENIMNLSGGNQQKIDSFQMADERYQSIDPG
jgi:ABC-type sugar transport system ATPase subunit